MAISLINPNQDRQAEINKIVLELVKEDSVNVYYNILSNPDFILYMKDRFDLPLDVVIDRIKKVFLDMNPNAYEWIKEYQESSEVKFKVKSESKFNSDLFWGKVLDSDIERLFDESYNKLIEMGNILAKDHAMMENHVDELIQWKQSKEKKKD